MVILYIDDSADIRSLLHRYLTSWGYETIGACDGETGWSMILEYHPDIVITDWIMPDIEGTELCRRIRAAGFQEYTYLIMLTALQDGVVAGMEAGADDFIAKPFNKAELRARVKAAARIIGLERELQVANSELHDRNRRLQDSEAALLRIAHFDRLTSLPNRVLFIDRLDRAIAESKRNSLSFGLLYIDLDEFKAVNDSLGHDTGDILLCEVAGRMSACVRASDTLARTGGDEFCVILREAATDDDAGVVAAKIVAAVSQEFVIADSLCRIGASIGIAIYPEDGDTREDLISRSDKAMYEAKKNGRNTWRRWRKG